MTLLHDALTAYLAPLLSKHASGQVLIYDDLVSSWEAAQVVLKHDASNDAVAKRLSELHDSQLRAYQDAAKKALHDYGQQYQLPLVQEDDTAESYTRKCVDSIEKLAWLVDEAVWEECCLTHIKSRARATFLTAQSKPAAQENHSRSNSSEDAVMVDENHQDVGGEEHPEEEGEGDEEIGMEGNDYNDHNDNNEEEDGEGKGNAVPKLAVAKKKKNPAMKATSKVVKTLPASAGKTTLRKKTGIKAAAAGMTVATTAGTPGAAATAGQRSVRGRKAGRGRRGGRTVAK